MNIEELNKFVEEHDFNFGYDGLENAGEEELDEELDLELTAYALLKKKFGDFEEVFSDRTGYDFDEYLVVLHFKEHDFYAGYVGYYSSHDGTDFSDAKFAEYEPVITTVYKFKK